jgi:alkylation response protein AidB-like acyl-CoA dehydrogenase
VAFIPGTRGDGLKEYLDRRSRSAEPADAVDDRGPLAKRKKFAVAVMLSALISAEYWVWMVLVPGSKGAAWHGVGHRLLSGATFGFLLSVLAVTAILATAVQLFTEVDIRGIHRPDWAGGDFIPWTSVTEVSTGASPEVLQVRAGEKKVNLSLMLFSNPAALMTLIRRHVPAERLKGI